MDLLHDWYKGFTEHAWLATIPVSFLLAVFILWRRTPRAVANCIVVSAAAVLPGWMLLDIALYPESHNLLPPEVLFKLLLLAPVALAYVGRIRLDRRRSPAGTRTA